jgi:hypothetical protein
MTEKRKLFYTKRYGADLFQSYEVLDEKGNRFVEIVKNEKEIIRKSPVRHHDPEREHERQIIDRERYKHA